MSKQLLPYPSNPTRPTLVHIYIHGGNPSSTSSIGFAAHWAAKRWIETLIKHLGKPDISNHPAHGWEQWTFGDYDLSTRHHDADYKTIMATKLTPEQQEWAPSDEVLDKYLITRPFAKGNHRTMTPASIRALANEQRKEKGLPPLTDKDPIPTRSTTPRQSKAGLITIQDLASELGIKPNKARKILRTKKVPQTQAGWAWTEQQAGGIRAILKAG